MQQLETTYVFLFVHGPLLIICSVHYKRPIPLVRELIVFSVV